MQTNNYQIEWVIIVHERCVKMHQKKKTQYLNWRFQLIELYVLHDTRPTGSNGRELFRLSFYEHQCLDKANNSSESIKMIHTFSCHKWSNSLMDGWIYQWIVQHCCHKTQNSTKKNNLKISKETSWKQQQ